jgi:hypothetical protein
MIFEGEKTIEAIEEILDLNESISTMVVQAPEFSPEDYVPFERVLERDEATQEGFDGAHLEQKRVSP